MTFAFCDLAHLPLGRGISVIILSLTLAAPTAAQIVVKAPKIVDMGADLATLRPDLDRLHKILLQERGTMNQKLGSFNNSDCRSVHDPGRDAECKKQQQALQSLTAAHLKKNQDYNDAVVAALAAACPSGTSLSPSLDGCTKDLAKKCPWGSSLKGDACEKDKVCGEGTLLRSEQCVRLDTALCAGVQQHAEQARKQIQTLIQTNDLSQQELAEWKKLNDKAQSEALKAGFKFVTSTCAAQLEEVGGQAAKLDKQIEQMAAKTMDARKLSTRLKYAKKLKDAVAALASSPIAPLEVGAGAGEAFEGYEFARDSLHAQLRVRSKHNEELRAVLNDPELKEFFVGDNDDKPGVEALKQAAQFALEQSIKTGSQLDQYMKITGPTRRAAQFAIDASYSALASGLSTARVLQQSTVAGDLAQATASMQRQYQRDIDEMSACRRAGFVE